MSQTKNSWHTRSISTVLGSSCHADICLSNGLTTQWHQTVWSTYRVNTQERGTLDHPHQKEGRTHQQTLIPHEPPAGDACSIIPHKGLQDLFLDTRSPRVQNQHDMKTKSFKWFFSKSTDIAPFIIFSCVMMQHQSRLKNVGNNASSSVFSSV